MHYSELLKKHTNSKFIPYSELLTTTEWRNIRKNIISRDAFCCSKCGATHSHYQFEKNISFKVNAKINKENIIYQNKQIEDFKTEFKLDKITLLKFGESLDRSCAISNNGIVFIADNSKISGLGKEDLVIHSVVLESGELVPVIAAKKHSNIDDYIFVLPTITDKSIHLHVHHKHYILDKLPWEYENDSLITLCNWCHWTLHQNEIVPVYALVNGELIDMHYTPCKRCGGAGVFPEYSHIQSGVCFNCGGKRYEELISR